MGPFDTWLIYRLRFKFYVDFFPQGKRKRKQADEDSISIQSYDPNKSKVGVQPFWILISFLCNLCKSF